MGNIGSDGLQRRVAIIGAGPLGLIATKNLVEENFEVTTFERNEDVGGLWRANPNTEQTCVLPTTITNTSKFTVSWLRWTPVDEETG
jgi:dimethylaniline monooxygenase (N-oxide forming)